MNLSLNQLRAFHYAAECGSLTQAANLLFITQPAVSMQIKALEAQYGVRLIIRSKKKLELTEPGKRLYEITKKLFRLAVEAERVMLEEGDLPSAPLRIGSTKTLVRYLLAGCISRFRKSFPKIHIQINEGSSEGMMRSVLENRMDFAIIGRMSYPEKLEAIPFLQDELILLAGRGHPFYEIEEVSIEELNGQEIILREKGSGVRKVVEKTLEERGITVIPTIETENVDFIKELVVSTGGLTMLARMGLDEYLSENGVKAVRVAEGPLLLDIDIVINKERALSKADEAFLNVLAEERKFTSAISIGNIIICLGGKEFWHLIQNVPRLNVGNFCVKVRAAWNFFASTSYSGHPGLRQSKVKVLVVLA